LRRPPVSGAERFLLRPSGLLDGFPTDFPAT
jgi:hypothetical protein